MITISFSAMLLFISAVWIIVRVICCIKAGGANLKRELQLLLVYVCIVVVARFTFFPFGTVEGKIQPLHFDADKIFPLWVNLEPFVHLFDYPEMKDALINLIGNTAMFIPLGIVWPAVFKKLDTHIKVIFAGTVFSLTIEIIQLAFYERATDIDDLILNSLGFALGYGIYLLFKKIRKNKTSKRLEKKEI